MGYVTSFDTITKYN